MTIAKRPLCSAPAVTSPNKASTKKQTHSPQNSNGPWKHDAMECALSRQTSGLRLLTTRTFRLLPGLYFRGTNTQLENLGPSKFVSPNLEPSLPSLKQNVCWKTDAESQAHTPTGHWHALTATFALRACRSLKGAMQGERYTRLKTIPPEYLPRTRHFRSWQE